eukprot:TRINITY_DN0_c2506_g1_i1.p1 TRINITY_DN0_c2506_g1~~TRINITY_DN0_c2506_g1_i1.p1  ORF type:complete len:123 (+),score=35.58 TRINITY_DN0_c2506_g1_i1:1-369(+)
MCIRDSPKGVDREERQETKPPVWFQGILQEMELLRFSVGSIEERLAQLDERFELHDQEFATIYDRTDQLMLQTKTINKKKAEKSRKTRRESSKAEKKNVSKRTSQLTHTPNSILSEVEACAD